MKCPKCGQSSLRGYSPNNLNYILNGVEGKWYLSDPRIKDIFFTTRTACYFKCWDCRNEWKGDMPQVVYSPEIKHSELVLDLDHTLFYAHGSYYKGDLPKWDFEVLDPEGKYNYKIIKRPHLDEFIAKAIGQFNKINFFTSAADWYAQQLVKSLNIPEEKMGYLKSRADTCLERCLSFEREYMKYMSNSLVIDDKPLVISGFNNSVFKIEPFEPYFSDDYTQDNELMIISNYFNQDETPITMPKILSGEVELFLKDLVIEFSNLPTELWTNIIEIPSPNQEYLSTLKIQTSEYQPYFQLKDGQSFFSFVDLTYENYQNLLTILGSFTSHQILGKNDFDMIIENNYAKSKQNFDF